jgi:hypothetical protein
MRYAKPMPMTCKMDADAMEDSDPNFEILIMDVSHSVIACASGLPRVSQSDLRT